MSKDPNVYIVDDDQGDRDSLSALLSSAGYSVRSYASAMEFLQDYDGVSTGCVVADYRMENFNGLELQKRILAEDWGLPVIIITGFANVPLAVEAMQNGALTLLEKPYDDQELIEAVSQGIKINAKWHRRQALQKSIRERVDSLTISEQQVLALLLKGLPNKQISTRLDVGLRTVERRRNLIFKKMQVKDVASIARQLTILERHQIPLRDLCNGLAPEVTSK